MFFKKKKPTPQAEAAPSAAKETVNKPAYPYHEALDWTVERMALKEKQAKAGWTAAKIMGCLLVLVSIICIVIAVKKEAYPFIVELDKSNGTTRVIDIRDPQNIPADEMMDKYWLNLYTQSHESYDYRTLENDHARVRLMSVPEVFNPYDHQYGLDNKKSLQNLLKTKRRSSAMLSPSFPTETESQPSALPNALLIRTATMKKLETLGVQPSDMNTTRIIRWTKHRGL